MKIPTFLITVVGYSIAPLVESLFLAVGINPVNPPNNGQLGNFRTLTYRFEFFAGRRYQYPPEIHVDRAAGEHASVCHVSAWRLDARVRIRQKSLPELLNTRQIHAFK